MPNLSASKCCLRPTAVPGLVWPKCSLRATNSFVVRNIVFHQKLKSGAKRCAVFGLLLQCSVDLLTLDLPWQRSNLVAVTRLKRPSTKLSSSKPNPGVLSKCRLQGIRRWRHGRQVVAVLRISHRHTSRVRSIMLLGASHTPGIPANPM